MDKKKNIILLILLFVILFSIIIVIYIVNSHNNEEIKNDIKYNNTLYDEVVIDNISIIIEEIKYDGVFSDITLKLTNNTNNDINYSNIKLTFKDDNSNIVGELLTSNTGTISSGNSTILKTSIDVDLSLSTKVEYELIGDDSNE